jgi:outer membrane protein assembly factor BamE
MHSAMFARDFRTSLVLLAWALAAAGCGWFSPYRMEIQQGNFVSQEAVSQLRPGMTREQVRFVLGTPLVADPFRTNRWDYVYRRQLENSSGSESRRLTVFFENDVVARVEGDVKAAAPAAASN